MSQRCGLDRRSAGTWSADSEEQIDYDFGTLGPATPTAEVSLNLVFLRTMKAPAASFARDIEEPIRAELFSIERLEQHGETLAVAQRITDDPGGGRPIASRIRDNARVLLEVYRGTATAIREERAITPAAEWLVDNFHVVEEQIREIRDDLSRGFYRQLPKTC